ncbi:hypothetical protein PUN28_009324 [Cardiocondyla obscurior]|uniref:Uncharacterized protein n=1 Tax=Cardiocondyla obscurior TaxID=286306 RepID=A0AAW2FT80_9HYME
MLLFFFFLFSLFLTANRSGRTTGGAQQSDDDDGGTSDGGGGDDDDDDGDDDNGHRKVLGSGFRGTPERDALVGHFLPRAALPLRATAPVSYSAISRRVNSQLTTEWQHLTAPLSARFPADFHASSMNNDALNLRAVDTLAVAKSEITNLEKYRKLYDFCSKYMVIFRPTMAKIKCKASKNEI